MALKFMHLSAFDLDKTLLNVNSSYAFSKFLYAQGVFSLKDRLYSIYTFLRFYLTGTSLDALHQRVFRSLFKGRFLSDFENQVEPFLNEAFDSIINKKAIDCLERAQASQHAVILLSSSPSFLVGPIAKRLKISDWFSTEYQTDKEGRFCHISCLMNGSEKADRLNRTASDLNIPLHQTIAYSDSYEDIPFLSLAGTPIAVNPDKKLLRISRKKNWKIL
jgi:HAD superfamily hydrolase (TIGR01490 family)